LLVLVLIFFSSTYRTFAQIILADSIRQKDSLLIKSNLITTPVKALGNFAITPYDKIGFQTYAGSSVLNVLRGHSPNFLLGPNATSPAGVMGSLLIIDGLPYGTSIDGYYNFNSFEYKSIYAFRSGNASAMYGGVASNGSIYLQSKTGEGIMRPTFEFNSSSTIVSEPGVINSEPTTIRQWVYTNSLAYQQDFGIVDTRVSYSFSAQPEDNSTFKRKSNRHAVKINTGLALGSKFRARLILDHYFSPSNYQQEYFIPGLPPTTGIDDVEELQKNLQANLQMLYHILPWLSVSSQSSLSKLNGESSTNLDTGPESEQQLKRTHANLFVNANHKLFENLSVNAFVGGQYQKYRMGRELRTSTSSQGASAETETKTLLAGAGLQFKDFLFEDFTYRKDFFNVFGPDHNSAPTYAFNTAFVFSDALRLRSSLLSWGKLRASLGNASAAFRQLYPDFLTTELRSAYSNPSIHASSKFMSEYGVDLGFAGGRIGIAVNYFKNNEKDLLVLNWVPGPFGTPRVSVIANRGPLKTSGWEAIVNGAVLKRANLLWETKLILTTYETSIGFNASYASIGAVGSIFGHSDWAGSLMNQVTWKGFFSSILIDIRKGEDFVSYYPTRPGYTLIDGTMCSLRDLSVGYRIVNIEAIHLQEVQVSVSGRNLWEKHSKTDLDTESGVGAVQKNICLSLTVSF